MNQSKTAMSGKTCQGKMWSFSGAAAGSGVSGGATQSDPVTKQPIIFVFCAKYAFCGLEVRWWRPTGNGCAVATIWQSGAATLFPARPGTDYTLGCSRQGSRKSRNLHIVASPPATPGRNMRKLDLSRQVGLIGEL